MPLSDEQIGDLWMGRKCLDAIRAGNLTDQLIWFARAIESAATAPLLAQIAELEQRVAFAEDAAKKGDDARAVAGGMEMTIAELQAQLLEAKIDAERYRWLRKQHWSENLIGVVVRPKDNTILGSILPCGSLLDDSVDHMKSTQAAMQKGAQ